MYYNKKFHIGRTVKKLLFYFNKKILFFQIIATTFVSLVVVFAVVEAGSLTPSGPPGASGFSLSDIYNRLTGNVDSQEAGHSFAPADKPGGSMYSLKQIYETIPIIDPAKVFLGISYLGVTGTLTPDGGTAGLADLFNGQTAQLTADWDLDTGTLNLACNTTTFDGALNLVANTYDGGGNGTNRWCMTDSGDAAATDIRSGQVAWIDGQAVTGTADIYVYGSDTASDVLTTATAGGTYDATNLNVGTVKSGTSFGVSLTGDYPSVTYPLPSASGTTDLAGDGSDITSSNGAVEWWTSDGTRQSATLDFPGLSNLCRTDTSNNSAGTLSVTAAAIRVGSTYCGTAGTLLANLFNGTTGAYPGGSQANGGGDDFNNGGAAPVDRYSKTWTACTGGVDNYCGTGDSGADAQDDSTGLIWSLPCNGVGCTSLSDAAPTTYTWDNSGPNNNSLTASQLCSGHAGWSLPHQKQFMQAYIDGSYGNLEAITVNRPYWSATTQASSPTGAWATYLSIGGTGTTSKAVNGGYVRCVR
jgi:hypothetical protein